MRYLVKTLVAFFPCLGNLPEAEFESTGVIYLVRAISRERNVESLAWLLLIVCIDVYGEKEQQVRKKAKRKRAVWREKGAGMLKLARERRPC